MKGCKNLGDDSININVIAVGFGVSRVFIAI